MRTDSELKEIEAIAEFMEIKTARYDHYLKGTLIAVVPDHGAIDWPELTEYAPDKSWNDLMPVVEKIDCCYSLVGGLTEDYCDEYQKVEDALTNNYDIKETHKAVVEFIKWYNENKT